jgi:hypothetical protein
MVENCKVLILPDYYDGVDVRCVVCNVTIASTDDDRAPIDWDLVGADYFGLDIEEVAWKAAQHKVIGKKEREAAALYKKEQLLRAKEMWNAQD